MNRAVVTMLYAVTLQAMLWLALLWLGARLGLRRPGPRVKGLLGVVAGLALFVPLGGLPLWCRMFSYYPNPSLPMLGLVGAALGARLFGREFLPPADRRAVWIFGFGAGSLLYLNPILFGAVDLYYWGWQRDTAVWSLAAVAVGFLLWGNRLGVLLFAALVAYAGNALESQNCWDYVMDPLYWLLSAGAIGARLLGAARRWLAGRREPGPVAEAGQTFTAML